MRIANKPVGGVNVDWLEDQFFLGYDYNTNEI